MGLHISNSSLLHSIPGIPLLHWRHWEQLLPTFLRLSFTLCVSVCVYELSVYVGVCMCVQGHAHVHGKISDHEK